MGTSAGHRPLSADDLESYHERGYLLYRDQVFDEGGLADLDAIFREHRDKDREKRGDEFDTPHFQDPRLLEFLFAPALLDLVECIVGPNIVLWSSHFICKDPLVGRATPWHEDSSYWMGRLSRYDKIVTVWLALDDVDPRERLYAGHPRFSSRGWVFVVQECGRGDEHVPNRDLRHRHQRCGCVRTGVWSVLAARRKD